MPHVSSGGGGDDLGSTDEVKVFKDEGEDEKRSSENLTEEKSSLIDLTESEEKSGSLPGQSYTSSKNVSRSDHSPVFGKVDPTPHTSSFNMGYLVSPYPYPNGAAGPIPVSMASKMGLAPAHPGAALPFFCHNGDHLAQPPPAHMGIPPYQLDPKASAGAMGLTRPPMYPFSAGQYPYPMLSPEMSQVAASWSSSMDQKISTSSGADGNKTQESGQTSNNQDKKKPHIKKPLNAFMLYMKEMRAKVVAECTLKESAAINQILGRRWHSLSREEQAKYYEKARQERQLHMQLYPGWSARDNYGNGAKKKKRKKERSADPGGNSMKKCRARYGLDQQSQWCKPCRRKKKCIRYMESGDSVDGNQSEDNLGSCGSAGEAQTPPEEDSESLHHSLSSPGGLSGLSSLTSPSMILPSPSTSLASPSVSMASPCMSLQSPLTPHESSAFECKPSMNNMNVLSNHQPTSTSSSTNAVGSSGALSLHHHHPPHHPPPPGPPLHRNPVGTNPHDINNPLSVNQLTGQCIKTENNSGNKDSSSNSRPVISVT